MSPGSILLRYTFLFIVIAVAVQGAWELGSGTTPPFGTVALACVFVYLYDRLVVRPGWTEKSTD